MSVPDWLALPTDVVPPPPAVRAVDPRRLQIAKLKRQMPTRHRIYANCLVEARLNTQEANRLFAAQGYNFGPATLANWRRTPNFRKLLELTTEEVVTAAGISAQKTLLQVDAIAEYGGETIVKRNKHGQIVRDEVTGEPIKLMRDPRLALNANELMGKHQRLWNTEDTGRVVLELVDLTGQARIRKPIEGEAEVVDGQVIAEAESAAD